jgi:hypothetical protein
LDEIGGEKVAAKYGSDSAAMVDGRGRGSQLAVIAVIETMMETLDRTLPRFELAPAPRI